MGALRDGETLIDPETGNIIAGEEADRPTDSDDNGLEKPVKKDKPADDTTGEEEDTRGIHRANDDDDDEDDEDKRPDSELSDDEVEARKLRRKQERKDRKERQRRAQEDRERRIQSTEDRLKAVTEELSGLKNRSNNADLARINTSLESWTNQAAAIKGQIAIAIKEQNGEAAAELQDKLYEARRNVEMLDNIKARATAASDAGANQGGNQRQEMPPAIKRHADAFMAKHKWFNPADLSDDSGVAVAVDQAVFKAGFRPETPEYWAEFESRLKKYLPHRFKRGNIEQDDSRSEPGGDEPRRRSPTGGSGQDGNAGGKGSFVLGRDQVQAIKDAGMWEDLTKRAKMVKRYRDQAATAKRS